MTDNKPKILVVDDEERTRIALGDILLTQDYQILEASDGLEALEKIADEAPDVVLLDIRLPRLSGLEVTRKVKGDPSTRHIPLIIVTGLDEMELRIQALKLGADDFLIKPPHVAELTARVRSLVKVKAYHDHLLDYQKKLEEAVSTKTRLLRETLEELARAHQKLKESSLHTIYSLSRASEYRDENTAAHIRRMSQCAAAVARRIGLDDAAVETILYASPMHDIGKIGIPDRILLKPGKLTPEEWAVMKQHTLFGSQILSAGANGFLTVAQVIALAHHERWDGSGYPRGLKGTDIPLEGRIAAIADVFDALTSNRPYKKAFPIEEALQIVRESSGSHFDPRIVEAFFEIQDEIFSIRERHPDEGSGLLFRLTPASVAGGPEGEGNSAGNPG